MKSNTDEILLVKSVLHLERVIEQVRKEAKTPSREMDDALKEAESHLKDTRVKERRDRYVGEDR